MFDMNHENQFLVLAQKFEIEINANYGTVYTWSGFKIACRYTMVN